MEGRCRLAPLLAGFILYRAAAPLDGEVVISEIHYHPAGDRPGDDSDQGDPGLEFLEVSNSDPTAADLSGYSFTSGVHFTFPRPTILEGR